MKSEIPDVITTYLGLLGSGNAADVDEMVACFTETAALTDEGETRRGRSAIRQWWTGPATRYEYTVHLHGTRSLGQERYVVFTRLVGNFPGGTADLAHRLTLRDGLIATLEISPPRPGEESDAVPGP